MTDLGTTRTREYPRQLPQELRARKSRVPPNNFVRVVEDDPRDNNNNRRSNPQPRRIFPTAPRRTLDTEAHETLPHWRCSEEMTGAVDAGIDLLAGRGLELQSVLSCSGLQGHAPRVLVRARAPGPFSTSFLILLGPLMPEGEEGRRRLGEYGTYCVCVCCDNEVLLALVLL